MDDEELKIMEVVGALANIEKETGGIAPVTLVAERTGFSRGSAHTYLRLAAAKGLIAQRRGSFMTLGVARALDKPKKGE